MVDMPRAHPGRCTRERVQQHDGIDAARQPDENVLALQFRGRAPLGAQGLACRMGRVWFDGNELPILHD